MLFKGNVCSSDRVFHCFSAHLWDFTLIIKRKFPSPLSSFRACRQSSCFVVVCCFVINQTYCYSNILWIYSCLCVFLGLLFAGACLKTTFCLIQACFLFHYEEKSQNNWFMWVVRTIFTLKGLNVKMCNSFFICSAQFIYLQSPG